MLYEIKNIVQLHNLAKQRKDVATHVYMPHTRTHTLQHHQTIVTPT